MLTGPTSTGVSARAAAHGVRSRQRLAVAGSDTGTSPWTRPAFARVVRAASGTTVLSRLVGTGLR
jgi:hypothetical protein